MEPVIVEMERQVPGAGTAPFRPNASMWLWRPWYAKVWWAAIAIYWSSRLASHWNDALAEFYATPLAGLLNIVFFPPAAMLILGVGFVRARFASSPWEIADPTHEEMSPKRSMGGWTDPYSDPIDPRSGPRHWRRYHKHM